MVARKLPELGPIVDEDGPGGPIPAVFGASYAVSSGLEFRTVDDVFVKTIPVAVLEAGAYASEPDYLSGPRQLVLSLQGQKTKLVSPDPIELRGNNMVYKWIHTSTGATGRLLYRRDLPPPKEQE